MKIVESSLHQEVMTPQDSVRDVLGFFQWEDDTVCNLERIQQLEVGLGVKERFPIGHCVSVVNDGMDLLQHKLAAHDEMAKVTRSDLVGMISNKLQTR